MKLVERQEQGFQPMVGFAECKVVAINPNREEVIKLLNVSEDKEENIKEKEYIGETDEGDAKVSIDFYLEEVNTKKIIPFRMSLIDKVQTNKDGDKTQYVSATADSTWVDDVDNLPVWFKHFTNKDKEVKGDKQYREAKVGEANLYTFMRNWLGKVNFWDAGTDVLLDTKKLMRGNVSELTTLMNSEFTTTVGVMLEVRVKETEDGLKYYQGVYNKNFLPGYLMKVVRNTASSEDKDWTTNKIIKKFVEEIEGDYGSKNIYILDVMQPFDESMSVASSNETVSDDGSDY